MTVQVQPNARKSEIAGLHDDAVKIRLQAPPVDGKANEALIRFIADLLDIPKSRVAISHGQASRRKLVEISGAKADEAIRSVISLL
ncbi:DUF167 domain-containing protein [Noviherbaspirillum aerium]|uniref:DUF167 domain-containing protein n=1 Tax=Noviherbaspirillum aerium TaxID=2588497 RepID=UPI0021F421C8|nr:DUF167 domain-containing protein [Noviherbaspirillum aerium]